EVVEPNDSNLCVVTTYSLDNYGRKQSITTRNCNGSAAQTPTSPAEAAAPAAPVAFSPRSESHTYTADQRFVATSTNAAGHTETKAYDARFGTTTRLTGPNALTTEWRYDAYGRKVIERRADGNGTRWDYKFCTSVAGGTEACPTIAGAVGAYVVTATPVKAPIDLNAPASAAVSGPYAKVYYDALGREIRTETQSFDGSGPGPLIYQDTEYNNLGQVSRKSRPYYSGASASWTAFTYDKLGRPTIVDEATAAGTATRTTTYNGLVTTSTDPLNRTTTETRNLVGELAVVTDAKGGTLSRVYDPHGNLVQTTDAKGNVISLVYDLRGRRTAMYDPDMGVWMYAYNALGELVRQTDPKLQVSTMTYDALGRLVTRVEPDLTSNWYYDKYADGSACNKGVGKLCEAKADNGYSRKSTFDGLGRVVSTAINVGALYTAGVSYDALGRVDVQTYPSGLQVKNTYTAGLGLLWKVTDLRTNTVLWTADRFDAEGHPLQYTYGNGVVTTNDYYVDGRLNTSRAGPNGNGGVQVLSHNYDLAGNLTQRVDLLTGVSAVYAYDELNRVTGEMRSGGSVIPAQTISWAYDVIGNMTSRTEGGTVNTYNYPSSGTGSRLPHAVASVSGSVNGYTVPIYSYDGNGNLTAGAGRSVSWTSFDKAQSIAKGSAKLDYLYDADHERAKESYYLNGALQRSTVYLNPGAGAGLYYEEERGVAGLKQKHYITAGNLPLGMIVYNGSSWSTQYWHRDHLGSISVVTNESGAVVERMAYEPFGKRRSANGVTDPNGTFTAASTDRGYTGHEHLDEVGLINMNGRVYDPGLARFMSADPYVQSPNVLQSYNRYAYLWNSPLSGTDPSGYKSKWLRPVVAIAVAAVIGVCWDPGTALFQLTGVAAGATSGAIAGAASGAISTGTAKGALQGAFSGAIFGGIGGAGFGGAEAVAAHALAGCVTAAASGGNCGRGALTSGFAKLATVNGPEWMRNPGMDPGKIAAGAAYAAVVGGTASAIGGEKFANGAMSGAFAYIVNQAASSARDSEHLSRKVLSPAGAANAPNGPYMDPTWQELGIVADNVMTASMLTPIGPEVQAARIGLTKLMSYGVESTAAGAGQGLITMSMGAGRSASADFAALATNYGATVETVATKAGQSIQRFNVGEATVVLRDFGRTAGTTIQVTVKGIVDGIKLRYP
ncbi:MAG TPA: RHS repeat-associated core domain-containing protein, partial [Burkholderiaceae bacterium]|nr:RHS repeat-associated core domain-containing protein [Burkholderiaceae bacterium]